MQRPTDARFRLQKATPVSRNWYSWQLCAIILCQISRSIGRKLRRTRTCERRDAGDRRETALQGRVQARSPTSPALYTFPENAVSRAVEPFAEAAVSGRK